VTLVFGEPIVVEGTDDATLDRKVTEVGLALGALEEKARALLSRRARR
jgi:hypothetical protein